MCGIVGLFAKKENIDPLNPPLNLGIAFLTSFFQNGSSYGQINTARSAMSSIIITKNELSWGKLPYVKRFMKGVFELRPSFPKYHMIWDVSHSFEFVHFWDLFDLFCI